MDDAVALRHLDACDVGVLGTVGPHGEPHLVPCVFALTPSDLIVTAVDHKPKRTRRLRRLANIERDPRVCVLAHNGTSTWEDLWWVRVDGRAEVTTNPPAPVARALIDRHPPYHDRPPDGPWIVITIDLVRGWQAAPDQHRSPSTDMPRTPTRNGRSLDV